MIKVKTLSLIIKYKRVQTNTFANTCSKPITDTVEIDTKFTQS